MCILMPDNELQLIFNECGHATMNFFWKLTSRVKVKV